MKLYIHFLVMVISVTFLAPSTYAQESKESLSPSSQGSSVDPAEEPLAKESEAGKPAPLIAAVEIRGNQIVSTNTILSKIRSQKGEPLAQETINEDVKRLYATGYFQDIRMELEERPSGYTLMVVVEEKPIVRRITVEGVSVFKEDKIRKELKLIEGQILDRKVVKEGVEGIRNLYADKGFRFVDVQSDISINAQTREAEVKIRVIEGEKYKIKDVQFEGVKAFKPKKLRKFMKTKKDKWYTSGVFKEAEFQADLERLQLFYQQEGYLDVKIAPRFDYDKSGKKIFIIIQIEEGQHYVTGEIKIEGNQLFPESEIWQELGMLPGLTYSQYYLFKDIEKIRDYYYQRGYMEARVIPDIRLNKNTGKVDVTYEIQEGDLFFVDKVVVRGNTKTKDMVIRRELRIRPGERFDGEKIQKSKERLTNLDYFEDITYDTEPVPSAANRKNIIFRVKEKRTGELSFGGGISSVDRYVGFAEISQRNFDLWNFPRFTGGGQSLSIRARIGSISQDYSVSFVEPY
ncbi:MAG TPA: outer membrane protein assembly factor BamA, partial [bacterium]|nr:outer membrane protein assembly factor BamA [bacterium]